LSRRGIRPAEAAAQELHWAGRLARAILVEMRQLIGLDGGAARAFSNGLPLIWMI
jgi:hypothetical protein